MKTRPHRTPKRDNPSTWICVEEEDIRQGQQHSGTACPVALAMTRHFKRLVWVTRWWWAWSPGQALSAEPLPAAVQNWIGDYDEGLPVTPISFKVNLPDP